MGILLTIKYSVYGTTLYPEVDYWRPIPELAPPENSTLTIMFITPLRIFYLKSSDDPVFGTDAADYSDGDKYPWYYKSDPRSRVLACIDKSQLCRGDECWSMNDEPAGLERPAAYWLMKLSLETSNVHDAIVRRLGTALVAQERVSQYTSTPLADNHWQSEAERLFSTSLARIQFNAYSIASGEDRVHEGRDGYIDKTPVEAAGKLCGMFKFKSASVKNVNFWAFLLLIVLPLPLSFVLSRDMRQVKAFLAILRNWLSHLLCCGSSARQNNQGGEQNNVAGGVGEAPPAQAEGEAPPVPAEEEAPNRAEDGAQAEAPDDRWAGIADGIGGDRVWEAAEDQGQGGQANGRLDDQGDGAEGRAPSEHNTPHRQVHRLMDDDEMLLIFWLIIVPIRACIRFWRD